MIEKAPLRESLVLALFAGLLSVGAGAEASTVVVCELRGQVLAVSAPGLAFTMRVSQATRPREGRADSDCQSFAGAKVEVLLQAPPASSVAPGQPVAVRYRYMDQRGGMSSTRYELLPTP